ncbi:hypothetical protein E2562_028629 [Oryza meyeriana var. granulata]|uniref:Uncharacterized protein n=1 Tax=Oryza meyeriana var. granulata TaxID=110450 RepID=A0A6G1FD38_9ORYZ|nr:hypothetical protein E2562_028629 [Oryza meyeriana var. granulata]
MKDNAAWVSSTTASSSGLVMPSRGKMRTIAVAWSCHTVAWEDEDQHRPAAAASESPRRHQKGFARDAAWDERLMKDNAAWVSSTTASSSGLVMPSRGKMRTIAVAWSCHSVAWEDEDQHRPAAAASESPSPLNRWRTTSNGVSERRTNRPQRWQW